MSSCTTMYQVFQVNAPDIKLEKNSYVFKNQDLSISYNFWEIGGTVSFVISNNLDSAIYIDWDKSHLIYNGISYEYWNDSEETSAVYSSASSTSTSTLTNTMANILGGGLYGSSNSRTSTSGKKVSLLAASKSRSKRIIHVPPKSSIIVSKFSIRSTPFYDCNFNLKNTGVRSPNTRTFGKSETPVTFRNYLTYSIKENFEKIKTVDNEFYISSISFMTEKLFLGSTTKAKDCDINGKKLSGSGYTMPYQKPTAFYLKLKRK